MEKIGDITAKLENGIDGGEDGEADKTPESDKTRTFFGGAGKGCKGVIGAGIRGDFATTIGFGVALVALGTFRGSGGFIGFATAGKGVAVFPCWTVGEGGFDRGDVDAVAGELVDGFADRAGAVRLIEIV